VARRDATRDRHMSVCLAAGGVMKVLQVAAFTLSWTHSVEKTEWSENWIVTERGLEIVQARVKGSGAGIDPPAGAHLVDGAYQWKPDRPPLKELVLANSGAAGEWRICTDRCRTLADYFDVNAAPTTRLSLCAAG
jgi:hypothetical protein